MPIIREGAFDTKGAASKKALVHQFATVTPEQAETWIDNNVTDLASAKQALTLLTTMVIYLRDYVRITQED